MVVPFFINLIDFYSFLHTVFPHKVQCVVLKVSKDTQHLFMELVMQKTFATFSSKLMTQVLSTKSLSSLLNVHVIYFFTFNITPHSRCNAYQFDYDFIARTKNTNPNTTISLNTIRYLTTLYSNFVKYG